MENRWSLRDFGSIQFVWDSISGEYIKVHGQDAVTDEGPWELVCSEGGARLRSLSDEADPPAVIDPTKFAGLQIVVDGDGEVLVAGQDGECIDPPKYLSVWQQQNRSQVRSSVLIVPLNDGSQFKCEFYWETVPQMCGDQAVSLWLSFGWLLDFTIGKEGVDKAWRYASCLQTYLESLGLAATHVVKSARSQHTKKDRDAASACPEANAVPVDEWRISMMAAILFVENLISNKRFGGAASNKEDIVRKSKLALTMFLTWPRHSEETIAFALPKSRCEMFLTGMVVDISALAESEKRIFLDAIRI